MNTTLRNVLWLAVGLIVAGALIVWLTPRGAVAPTVPPLAADLYPLYSADWNAPHPVSLDIPPAPLSGTGIEAVVATSTMNPGAAFSPFDKYYADKLGALGWRVDNSLAAGGPGRGQVVYRKGAGFIAVNVWTDFHTVSSTSPMQCPCDVTIKLFSTTVP
ncbi:MAG: hypothetical protein B7X03_01355 [Parcubacteria group bacterium 21-58-10]|nr:MAG: hypothetical protein B7X03_01355 [Parcubacteria group bacterium 21-58-10]